MMTANTLEASVKKRARRNLIRDTLLTSIALVPAFTIAMAAPKVLSMIEDEYLDFVIPRDPKQRLRENISRLKRKGLIAFEKTDCGTVLHLTAKGRKELERLTYSKMPLQKPRRWDGRWRLVIFDIPETRKTQRNRIRSLVRGFGFFCLQDSVWVYPYDCEDMIALLKTDLRIGKDLLYIIADAIEYDRPLRLHFKLPLAS